MEDAFRIRVVVIDHSAFGRAALPLLIEADPSLEVVAMAENLDAGKDAILTHDPDVVVLAMHSEAEEAFEMLGWIMTENPLPVLALLPPNPDINLQVQVLEAGAAYVTAWDLNHAPARLMAFQSLLAAKLKAFGACRPEIPESARQLECWPLPVHLRYQYQQQAEVLEASQEDGSDLPVVPETRPRRSSSPTTGGLLTDREDTQELLAEAVEPLDLSALDDGLNRGPLESPISPAWVPGRKADVVVLGGGGGCVSALRQILVGLPEGLQLAVLAVVRLPPSLLPRFVDRLAEDCALPVSIAQEGDPVRPGHILLAPAGRNMGMVRTGRIPKALIRLMQPESGISATPALDVTLRAAAAIYGNTAIGIVLGGLSRDGLAGLQALRSKGGMTHMLDYKHAVIANTNRLCYEAGLVDDVSGVDSIIELLSQLGNGV